MQERKINLINCYASTNVKVMKSLDAQKMRNSSQASLKPAAEVMGREQLPYVKRVYTNETLTNMY